MRPQLLLLLTGLVLLLTSDPTQAADKWPKNIITGHYLVIKLYKPHVLNYTDSTVRSRFIISVSNLYDDEDPIFGVVWTTAAVKMDSAKRLAKIRWVRVDDMRFSDDTSADDIRRLTTAIDDNMPRVVRGYSLDSLAASAARSREEIEYTVADTGKKAPVIFYRTRPTVLVLIDGAPRLQWNPQWDVNVVENSPFVIVKDKDEKYYLYGGGHWYTAPFATGPFVYAHDSVSRTLRKIARSFAKAAKKDGLALVSPDTARMYDIIVSTVPAMLIQSNGDPQPAPVPGTSLVYIRNSPDHIFLDTASREYYLEAGGSWYQSPALRDSGVWEAISAHRLPADFAKIPMQSAEAEVLSNVPGTAAAMEATRDRSVPAVQKVDRSVTTKVDYDGAPEFSPIEGTQLQYATNTCAIVLLQNGEYYTLDDGIWFIAGAPMGPWRVSGRRPVGLELIPRQYPAYRSRFVYIFRTTAGFVWDGYLPGYLDDPSGGCGVAEMTNYDFMDDAWCFDLDFVFGWGGGGYDGYYRIDRHHRYYGSGGFGGKWAHWHHWRGLRPPGRSLAVHSEPRRMNTMVTRPGSGTGVRLSHGGGGFSHGGGGFSHGGGGGHAGGGGGGGGHH